MYNKKIQCTGPDLPHSRSTLHGPHSSDFHDLTINNYMKVFGDFKTTNIRL